MLPVAFTVSTVEVLATNDELTLVTAVPGVEVHEEEITNADASAETLIRPWPVMVTIWGELGVIIEGVRDVTKTRLNGPTGKYPELELHRAQS